MRGTFTSQAEESGGGSVAFEEVAAAAADAEVLAVEASVLSNFRFLPRVEPEEPRGGNMWVPPREPLPRGFPEFFASEAAEAKSSRE